MTTLAQYDRACAALAEATQIDEVLPLLDEFELVKLRAKQIKDHVLLARATEFQMRAERRLGEVIHEAQKAGLFRQGRQKEKSDGEDFSRPTLEEAGVDKTLAAKAKKRAEIPERDFELMVTAECEHIAADHATDVGGARSIMSSRLEPGDSADLFPTPPWATRALMDCVLPHLGVELPLRLVWEPACGFGHMAEVLCEYSRHVTATDKYEWGYGTVKDFLAPIELSKTTEWIITNPPFREKALQFVDRALAVADNVAMFFRSQWAVEGIERYEQIFRDTPPTLCAFFVERVNLCKGRWNPSGTTATAYCWLVWLKDRAPQPTFWIPPGQRERLTYGDDTHRFTQHPVQKKNHQPAADHESPAVVEPAPTPPPGPSGAGSSFSEVIDIPEFLQRKGGANNVASSSGA